MSYISSSYGFFSIVKGVVTRRPIDSKISDRSPDPLGFRLQVWIPAYHGGSEPNESFIYDVDDNGNSTKSGFGLYPWAQICSINYGSTAGDTDGFVSKILKLLGNDQVSTVVIPEVGDIVWLAFEGGDINSPVYIGDVLNKEDLEARIGLVSPSGVMSSDPNNLLSIIREIIVEQETGILSDPYSGYDPNDNGGISIGIIGFHESSAREVLRRAREINQTEFDRLANSKNAPEMISKVMSTDNSWSGYQPSKNSSQGQFISAVLTTDYCKQAQNEVAESYFQKYVDDIKKYGTKDDAVIIFLADVWNQYGSAHPFCNDCLNASTTIDQIFNSWKSYYANRQAGGYPTRRTYVYNKIKGLIADGTLVKTNGNHYVVAGSGYYNPIQYEWPCPNHSKIITKYSSNNFYIEISDSNIKGADVVAAHSGTATFIKSRPGYQNGNRVKIRYETQGNPDLVRVAQEELQWATNAWNSDHSAPYNRYSLGGDWCAWFVSYCAQKANVSSDYLPAGRHGFASYSYEYYTDQHKGVWCASNGGTYIPSPGDVIVFLYPNSTAKIASHIGIVEYVATENGKIRVHTIEGNSGTSYASNWCTGSQVKRNDYAIDYVGIKGYSKTSSSVSVLETEYGYLNSLTRTGEVKVNAGDKIGTVGSVGNVYKLYFSMKENDNYIDPVPRLKSFSLPSR